MRSQEPSKRGFPNVSLEASASYFGMVEGAFLTLIGQEGLTEIAGDGWVTNVDSLDVGIGARLCGAGYHSAVQKETLLRLDGVVAHVILVGENVNVRLAARDRDSIRKARAELRGALPEIDADARGEVPFTFWWETDYGCRSLTRALAVPTLDAIVSNYSATTGRQLEELAGLREPTTGGQLMLWHGEPGAGKTYAIRALAWKWREWCDFHYVTDPDALFNSGSGYLVQMVTRHAEDRDDRPGKERWRCLVLEDTGELMSADAKQRAGQALSRLLNVVDGLIGQGFNVLVLVTTNEPLRKLHPAAVRPGRCLAEIEFGGLCVEEANAWLNAQGVEDRVSSGRTLAELYALIAGRGDVVDEPKFGFAA